MTSYKKIEQESIATTAAALAASEKRIKRPNGDGWRAVIKGHAIEKFRPFGRGWWEPEDWTLDGQPSSYAEIAAATGVIEKNGDCLDCMAGWPCIHNATRAARATRRGE